MNPRYSIELRHRLAELSDIKLESDDKEIIDKKYRTLWIQYGSIDGFTLYVRDREKLRLIACHPDELLDKI